MRPRSLLIAATAAIALSLVPLTAQAAETVYIDRAAFDGAVEQDAGSFRVEGATRGELGGYLDVTVRALDGTLPVGSNVCETARVRAVLTVAPGDDIYALVRGQVCTGFSGDSLTMSTAVHKKDVHFRTINHPRAKALDDAMINVGVISWFGGNAAFSVPVKW